MTKVDGFTPYNNSILNVTRDIQKKLNSHMYSIDKNIDDETTERLSEPGFIQAKHDAGLETLSKNPEDTLILREKTKSITELDLTLNTQNILLLKNQFLNPTE